ncbi:hypothetical protein K1719_038357 [Acacia pycnantha]|nr:hypothetical protein K1719_038357 [Acacia pycnantha]
MIERSIKVRYAPIGFGGFLPLELQRRQEELQVATTNRVGWVGIGEDRRSETNSSHAIHIFIFLALVTDHLHHPISKIPGNRRLGLAALRFLWSCRLCISSSHGLAPTTCSMLKSSCVFVLPSESFSLSHLTGHRKFVRNGKGRSQQ